jgi:tight adherence protein B
VALRSKVFEQAPLRRLADTTNGEYTEAVDPAALEPLFDRLGSRFASDYVVRYRSLAGPGEAVMVQVMVAGVGSGTAEYQTPALPIRPRAPFRPPLALTFWHSTLAMLAVCGAAALLLGLALAVVLRPRRASLRTRMSEFVTIYLPTRSREAGKPLPDKVFDGAERSLERTRWWARFKDELLLAGIAMPAVQIVLWTVVATFGVMWLLYALGGVLLALPAFLIPFVVRAFIKARLQRVRNQFAMQLPDNLQVLASALRAGHSLVGALSVVVDDAPEPSRMEFRRVIADEQLGVPLEEALTNVAERMDNRDLEQVAVVAALQHETGGNTAEVLDRVTDTIRERFELRRMIKALTAQGRMSRWVVSLLPVGLLLAITVINPGYMKPLYESTSGRILLAFAALMVLAGSFVIRKIINFKV